MLYEFVVYMQAIFIRMLEIGRVPSLKGKKNQAKQQLKKELICAFFAFFFIYIYFSLFTMLT